MPRRIVFVCTGNSCRSPLAEVLARARFADLPLTFASAGIDAVPGRPASDGARTVARELGLDLEGHRSTPVDAAAVDGAAWLIGLTRAHAAVLNARLTGPWPGRVGLLGVPGRDWRSTGPLAPGPGGGGFRSADLDVADLEVSDPWQKDLEAYRQVGLQIGRYLDGWSEVLRELCSEKS